MGLPCRGFALVQHWKSHHTIRTKLLRGTIKRTPLLSCVLVVGEPISGHFAAVVSVHLPRHQHRDGDKHWREAGEANKGQLLLDAQRSTQPRLYEEASLLIELLSPPSTLWRQMR